ncbi:hypothetical protein BDM02DRAFT_3191609 [Thelephora ganbajun]|uniref:Uncharacterized protein n=1 Tax=Thelephora ganbajun TaxID=370292 RepID=A0ACB6Z162_THEGA|nr:hypothetical protein BDM02DRAFT_3191609 [Thelephora ganbajun]
MVATKGKFDLAIALPSDHCSWIPLFIVPVLVIVTWGLGKPLKLFFDLLETLCLFLSIIIVKFSIEDGRTYWMSGTALERKEILESPSAEPTGPTKEHMSRLIPHLPQHPTQHPGIAELVKRYQDFPPASGVPDLAKAAFAPDLPENGPEKASVSDFKQGHAANVTPHQQRSLNDRITVPLLNLNSDS